MFSPYIMWLHLCLSFLKFQGQKHVKILILRDLNAEGAWCAVGWGKGKLASMCMNPRAEGGAGAEDRLMSSHPSVGLRWAEGGLVTCRSRRGAGCYHRPSVFLKINIMSQSMGLSSLNHTANPVAINLTHSNKSFHISHAIYPTLLPPSSPPPPCP